jgi:hypothetical protein
MKSTKKKEATTNHNSNHEVTTMKKTATKTHKTTSTAGPAGTSTSDVPAQLQALETSCGFGDPLPDATRTASEKLIRRVPASIVARVIALASRSGGTVAGIAFDPDTASAALTAADQADAIATAGQMLVRRAQDQSIRLRAGVTGDVSAIRTALRGYVKTAQGASLAQENDELRTLAKQATAARKARKTRAENAVTAASSPGTTEAEAPPPTPAPSAAPTAPTAAPAAPAAAPKAS